MAPVTATLAGAAELAEPPLKLTADDSVPTDSCTVIANDRSDISPWPTFNAALLSETHLVTSQPLANPMPDLRLVSTLAITPPMTVTDVLPVNAAFVPFALLGTGPSYVIEAVMLPTRTYMVKPTACCRSAPATARQRTAVLDRQSVDSITLPPTMAPTVGPPIEPKALPRIVTLALPVLPALCRTTSCSAGDEKVRLTVRVPAASAATVKLDSASSPRPRDALR
jgi:hypothetical protein